MPVTVVRGKFSQYSIPVFLLRIGGLPLRSGEPRPESSYSMLLESANVAACSCSVEIKGST